MTSKANPNFPTTRVLLFAIFVGLVALAIGLGSVSTVREGLTTGRVYSAGVILNFTEKIDRNSSPVAYWGMMALYGIACVGGIGLGVFVPIATIRAYIKKRAG
jgi:hypothetical protein